MLSFSAHPLQETRAPQNDHNPSLHSHPSFPLEIWELVFEDLADETLLIAARLSRLTPPIHTLVCRLAGSNLLRDLIFLRELIGRSPELHDLSLALPEGLSTWNTQAFAEVIGILYAMASQRSAKGFIIDRGDIYSGPPPTRASWMDTVWNLFGLLWGHGWRMTDFVNGPIFTMHCLWVDSGTREPFLLITTNSNYQSKLVVGRISSWEPAKPSALELAYIIPQINFPRLEFLTIREPVDENIFRDFLLRHATIWEIEYENPPLSDPPKILSHPLSLPFLTHIRCSEMSHLGPILDALGLSPQLRSIKIPIRRQSAQDVAILQRGFRRLCLIPTTITLTLDVRGASRRRWQAISDAEGQILGCLYPVSRLWIQAHSIPDVRLMIPWLAMLPRLNRVDFDIDKERRGNTHPHYIYGMSVQPVIEEARLALPANSGCRRTVIEYMEYRPSASFARRLSIYGKKKFGHRPVFNFDRQVCHHGETIPVMMAFHRGGSAIFGNRYRPSPSRYH
ncbi:hypothetical protein B0H11DRAFT_2192881 [Mycena galericulata]|nr:hypothetical protein B0H11DRAFT_2192881 [Mycena galericulata]